VKLIKQEKKKITASNPIDANKNSCSPKMYRKLQTKMQKMKIEQQVNAYQKPRVIQIFYEKPNDPPL